MPERKTPYKAKYKRGKTRGKCENMKSYPFTAYEKRVLRACGISAESLVYHGQNSTGAAYSLVNSWFYICGCYVGYTRQAVSPVRFRACHSPEQAFAVAL